AAAATGGERNAGSAGRGDEESITFGKAGLRQAEAAEAIAFEGVCPGEVDDDVRTAVDHARQGARKQRQIPVVADAVLEADIEVAAWLEQRVVVLLVHRAREHAGVALEDHGRSVAMVKVAIDERGAPGRRLPPGMSAGAR